MTDAGKSPRCAVLLPGHYRAGNIVESLRAMPNTDVFVFAWDDFGFKGSEKNLRLSRPEDVEAAVAAVPNLRSYRIARNKNFIESIREETEKRSYFNFSSEEVYIKSQLYSIKKSHELMEEYARRNGVEYDIVLKLRFDCSIAAYAPDEKTMDYVRGGRAVFVTNEGCHRHPHFPNGCMVCNKMYDLSLNFPHIGEHSNIICDLMAYGGPESMGKYCRMYDHYDEWNDRFAEMNRGIIKDRDVFVRFAGNRIKVGSVDHIFYLYCSYPERMLQHYMGDHLLVSSRSIRVNFHRR